MINLKKAVEGVKETVKKAVDSVPNFQYLVALFFLICKIIYSNHWEELS